MGILNYGAGERYPIEFDDRILAHLQLVIGAKLRLRQSFFFSWFESLGSGSGRGSIWIDASIPIAFHYATSQRLRINREWIEVLMASANSSNGLQLLPEPEAPIVSIDEELKTDRRLSSAGELVKS